MARGSTTKTKSGAWLLRWDGPRHPDGTRNQQQRTMRVTKKEAEAELNRIEADLAKSPAEKAAEMPVAELCRLFLEERSGTVLRPGTISKYEQLFRLDLLPECGDVPLGQVGRSVLQGVIQRMIDRDLAPSTIEVRHAYMSGLFSWGVVAGYLPDTPVKRLSLPECLHESAGQILSAREAVEVPAIFADTPCWLPTFLALHTGMRPGEMLGLSWDDVDLVGGTLSVCNTAHWDSGGLRLGPPKTKSSERSVAVSEDVVAVLRDQEQKKPEDFWAKIRRKAGDHRESVFVPVEFRQVCAGPDGVILTARSWRHDFSSGLRRAGLKEIRLHDLRHTHASLLLLDNVPMHVVSKRLGHKSIQTTINLYGHLLPTSDAEAANRFSAILRTVSQ